MATHVLDPQPQHEHNPPSSSPSAGYKVCKGKMIPHHDFDAQDSRQTLRPPKTFPCNKYLTTVTLQHTQRLLPAFDLVKFQRFNTKHAHPPSQQRRGLPCVAKAGLCCTSTTQSREKRISVSCRGECLQTTWKKYLPAVVVIRTPGRLGVGCRSSSLRQAGSKDHRHGHKPLSSKPKNKIPKNKTVSRSSRRREQ
jgi:hypothetical protein